MSLEQAIAALTAAVEANTAALMGVSAAAPASTAAEPPSAATEGTKKRGRPRKEVATEAAAPDAGKYDKSAMQAVLNEVKEQHGVAEAKRIIKEVGKADKMADINDPKLIDACYLAGKALLDGEDEGDDEGDDDDM